MAMHLSVQNKARHELDTILGTDRLPEFDDLDSLPYLKAVYMETLRWMPVVPLGVPHRVMEEDEYNGHRIPKGSIIIPVRNVIYFIARGASTHRQSFTS